MTDVRIHYVRPPEREELYVQRLVHRDEQVVVTLLDHTPLRRPVLIGGAAALEPGAPAVWFTFPGAWHDIGRFHRADDTFTGFYANILEPVRFLGPTEWHAVDLFLDVWLGAGGGGAELLDEDELVEALERGWIDAPTAAAARAEALRLLELARAGEWPPAVVRTWTLEQARSAADRADVMAADGADGRREPPAV